MSSLISVLVDLLISSAFCRILLALIYYKKVGGERGVSKSCLQKDKRPGVDREKHAQ